MTSDALPYVERPAAGTPEGGLILLHGRGADEYDLDWSRTVIGGFSQGTVMSYAVGLGPNRPSRWDPRDAAMGRRAGSLPGAVRLRARTPRPRRTERRAAGRPNAASSR